MLKLKRAYEKPAATDGFRILVDRLWPRGLTKQKAKVDVWLKDVAPSPALRVWFNHDPKKWAAFKRRYTAELRKNKKAVSELRALLKKHKTVTLVYAAKDVEHNDALVLQDFLS